MLNKSFKFKENCCKKEKITTEMRRSGKKELVGECLGKDFAQTVASTPEDSQVIKQLDKKKKSNLTTL